MQAYLLFNPTAQQRQQIPQSAGQLLYQLDFPKKQLNSYLILQPSHATLDNQLLDSLHLHTPSLLIDHFDLHNIGLVRGALIEIEDSAGYEQWREFTNTHLEACQKSIQSDHYIFEVWFKVAWQNKSYMWVCIIEMKNKNFQLDKDEDVKILEQQHRKFKTLWREIEHADVVQNV